MDKKSILAIDTSTVFGSVAVCQNKELVAQVQLGVKVTHSERLLATIESVLQFADIDKHQLDAVAVASGPGSFTGLRIGLATAKGLALGLDIPLYGISSLLTLAYNGLFAKDIVVSVIDARRQEVYAAAYCFELAHKNEQVKSLLPEQTISPKNLAEELKQFSEPLLFMGDGAQVYEQEFKRILGEQAIFSSFDNRYPQAANLASLAYEKLCTDEKDDLETLSPNYLRKSDAEIGFKGK
ncbi:MAG: tRNA (adenosine(37)-N6)-threonylcarbamoyltransferase complex dimerization subunit type 1 TsaB [Pseudomonadota bacterium]